MGQSAFPAQTRIPKSTEYPNTRQVRSSCPLNLAETEKCKHFDSGKPDNLRSYGDYHERTMCPLCH